MPPPGPGRRPYPRLLTATALSNLGDGVRAAALPLLAASLTDRPVLVAGVAAAGSLPWLLFGLPAGAVIDRVDRRRLAVATEIGRVGMLTVLVATLATGHAGLPLVYLVAFGCGVAETFRNTLTATLVPPLVSCDRLERANGHLVNAEVSGNEFAGPPLGGYLFGVALVLPFALNAGVLAVAAALIASLPRVYAPTGPATGAGAASPRTLWRDIVAGLRFLAGHRRLRTATLLGGVFALADSAWFPILVLYVEQILQLPPVAFGLLLSAGAAGGLGGAFVAAAISRRFGHTGALLGSLLLAAAAQLALGLTSTTAVAAVALAASSFAFGIWNVVAVTLRQRLTPPELLGRVNGSYRTLLLGIDPVAALAGGVIAGVMGLRAPILLGVPLLIGAALLGHRGLRADPAGAGALGTGPGRS
jgi:MFS family permease